MRMTYQLCKEFKSWEEFYEDQQGLKCVRTSYNTKLGQHSDPDKEPFRGNYAGIGNEYDEDLDIFFPPKNWDSWVKDPENFCWKAPIDMPDDGQNYGWREDLYQENPEDGWELIEPPAE